MAPREIERIQVEGVDIALGNLVRRLASSGRVILPAFLEGLRFRGKDAAGLHRTKVEHPRRLAVAG